MQMWKTNLYKFNHVTIQAYLERLLFFSSLDAGWVEGNTLKPSSMFDSDITCFTSGRNDLGPAGDRIECRYEVMSLMSTVKSKLNHAYVCTSICMLTCVHSNSLDESHSYQIIFLCHYQQHSKYQPTMEPCLTINHSSKWMLFTWIEWHSHFSFWCAFVSLVETHFINASVCMYVYIYFQCNETVYLLHVIYCLFISRLNNFNLIHLKIIW